ncbi:MAG: Rieske 2Fe-2S domain-containing protein [Acidimicrobiia bacterium]
MPRKRFPYPMPFGWFAIARVDELPDTPVTSLEYFDRELVLWHDGTHHHLVDAICPHLGAHIGVGGWVEGGCIVCPFHQWAYGPDGVNTEIPYADNPNRKARLHVLPTVERNGLLLAWYHPDRSLAPTFEVPEMLGDDFTECARVDFEVRTAWQEIAENSVDMAHFKYVHGLTRISEVGDLHIDGVYRRVESKQLFNSARGTFEGTLQSNNYGPGVGVAHFDLLGRVTLVSAITAIDDERVKVLFTFFHSGDPAAAKIGPAFAAEVKRQFEEDIPIWESKHFVPSPALAPVEKPITRFRSWASQFYVTPSSPA